LTSEKFFDIIIIKVVLKKETKGGNNP